MRPESVSTSGVAHEDERAGRERRRMHCEERREFFGLASDDTNVFWEGCYDRVDFCFSVGIGGGRVTKKGFGLSCDVAFGGVHVGWC